VAIAAAACVLVSLALHLFSARPRPLLAAAPATGSRPARNLSAPERTPQGAVSGND
jgi:hypothetical protein